MKNTVDIHNHDSHYLLGYFGITPSSEHMIECSREAWNEAMSCGMVAVEQVSVA